MFRKLLCGIQRWIIRNWKWKSLKTSVQQNFVSFSRIYLSFRVVPSYYLVHVSLFSPSFSFYPWISLLSSSSFYPSIFVHAYHHHLNCVVSLFLVLFPVLFPFLSPYPYLFLYRDVHLFRHAALDDLNLWFVFHVQPVHGFHLFSFLIHRVALVIYCNAFVQLFHYWYVRLSDYLDRSFVHDVVPWEKWKKKIIFCW